MSQSALILKIPILLTISASVLANYYNGAYNQGNLPQFRDSGKTLPPWNLDFLEDFSDEDDGDVTIIGSTIVHIVSPNEGGTKRGVYRGKKDNNALQNVLSKKTIESPHENEPLYANLKPISAYGEPTVVTEKEVVDGVLGPAKILPANKDLGKIYPPMFEPPPVQNPSPNQPIISFGQHDHLNNNPLAPSVSNPLVNNNQHPNPNSVRAPNQFNPNIVNVPNQFKPSVQNPNYQSIPPTNANSYNSNYQSASPTYANTYKAANPSYQSASPTHANTYKAANPSYQSASPTHENSNRVANPNYYPTTIKPFIDYNINTKASPANSHTHRVANPQYDASKSPMHFNPPNNLNMAKPIYNPANPAIDHPNPNLQKIHQSINSTSLRDPPKKPNQPQPSDFGNHNPSSYIITPGDPSNQPKLTRNQVMKLLPSSLGKNLRAKGRNNRRRHRYEKAGRSRARSDRRRRPTHRQSLRNDLSASDIESEDSEYLNYRERKNQRNVLRYHDRNRHYDYDLAEDKRKDYLKYDFYDFDSDLSSDVYEE